MIKAIILDLRGVFFTEGCSVAARKLHAEYGYDPKLIYSVVKSPKSYELRAGKISQNEFWEYAKTKLPKSYDMKIIKQARFDSYIPISGMKELIINLRKHLPVFVFSGNEVERVEYLENKYHFKELFDDCIFSFDAGYNKFEKEFFEYLIKRINLKPEECIYVDDVEKYIEVGKKHGFHTILFKNVEQLKKDIERIIS